MPRIPLHVVDAFTDRPFAGNPAAVTHLDTYPPDPVMQAIAAENNLSETAFIRPRGDGEYDLRWFTPATEVDLCGHATLAAGHIVLHHLAPHAKHARFHTRSGLLIVERAPHAGPHHLAMDLPADPPTRIAPPPDLALALGDCPTETWTGKHYLLAVFDTADQIRALTPDMRRLARLDARAICVTAPGAPPDVDFVSRLFAPKVGIDEDPVTGSAHCMLTPYWGDRLDRVALHARQISPRGGELHCARVGDRIILTGAAVEVMKGEMWW